MTICEQAPNYAIRRPDEGERAIQRLVVLMQMTAVGAPMIYYGDEAGMWGATDPDDRQPMVWADLKYASQTIDPRTGSRAAAGRSVSTRTCSTPIATRSCSAAAMRR